jgi:hypothetical protein
MSPIDAHEEPWLRDALGSLLVDEPPMPSAAVVDDVRRGAVALTAVKRRRTASLAIAAVVLAVAVPVGLVLRAAPNSATPPATSITSAPEVAGVSQEWLDRISPAVTANTAGWVVDWPSSTVTGDVATGLTLDLTLLPASVTGGAQPVVTLPTPPYPQTARLRLELLPAGKSPGAAMSSCPAATCPRDLPDRKFPTYLDVVAKAGNGTAFPAGTAILDRSYDAGRFVELVSLPPVSTGSGASDAAAGAVLPYPFAGAVLDAIGEPTSAAPTPVAFTPPSLDAALVNTGWQVVGQPQPLNSSPSWAYLLQPSDGSTIESANVMIFAAQQTTPGPYLAACTKVTCPGATSVTIADGATATSGYRETSTVAGEGLIVPKGSLIVDKAYGTGTLVEVVVTPPWNNAGDTRTQATATSVLTFEQTRAIIQLLGDPFSPRASASPTPTASASPVPSAQAEALRHPCTSADVAFSLAFVDGLTAERPIALVARNISKTRCGLDGAPVIGLSGRAPLRLTYVVGDYPGWPSASTSGAVLLVPGGEAHSFIAKSACTGAPVATATSISVQLPHGSSGSAVAVRGVAPPVQCPSSEAPNNVVHVSAFEAGGIS